MNLAFLLKFLPGANVLALPMAVIGFIGNVIKWTWKGIEDCFTHPATFLVCAVFAIGGGYGMAKFVGHRVSELRVELRTSAASSLLPRRNATNGASARQTRRSAPPKPRKPARRLKMLPRPLLCLLLLPLLGACTVSPPPPASSPLRLPDSACRVFKPIESDPVDIYRKDKGAAIKGHNAGGATYCRNEPQWASPVAPS